MPAHGGPYEMRVEVSKPAGRGREAEVMTVPVICWQPELEKDRAQQRAYRRRRGRVA